MLASVARNVDIALMALDWLLAREPDIQDLTWVIGRPVAASEGNHQVVVRKAWDVLKEKYGESLRDEKMQRILAQTAIHCVHKSVRDEIMRFLPGNIIIHNENCVEFL